MYKRQAVLFVIMIVLAEPISSLMQAPKEALSLTKDYVRICGGGIFFIVAYNFLSAIFRGLGDKMCIRDSLYSHKIDPAYAKSLCGTYILKLTMLRSQLDAACS